MEIAFFGLGTMGVPMVKNLLSAGYQVKVTAYKGKMAGPKEVEKYGANIAESLAEAVRDAEVIISIVPDDQAVRSIYLNPEMHRLLKAGATIIEMTSCSQAVILEVAEYYQDKGIGVIDAPVTGAKMGAELGTLTIMGAGEVTIFAKVEPILRAMGKTIYHLGPVGHGKLIKAMTNLLGAINLVAVGEIYRFAQDRGLDLAQLSEVVAHSAGSSTQFDRNFIKMVNQDYAPTFTLKLLRKDMALALEMAGELSLPLAHYAYGIYQKAEPFDQEDCSAIAKVIN